MDYLEITLRYNYLREERDRLLTARETCRKEFESVNSQLAAERKILDVLNYQLEETELDIYNNNVELGDDFMFDGWPER